MRAIVSVIGKDSVGIIAAVTAALSKEGVNVEEITQSLLQSYFVMIMVVDISAAKKSVSALADELDALGEKIGVQVKIQHEDIFNSMHKI